MRIGRPFLKLFLALAFCFIGMANNGFAANIATVDATGRAALSGHSEQKARRFALEDALYLAALQNVCVSAVHWCLIMACCCAI